MDKKRVILTLFLLTNLSHNLYAKSSSKNIRVKNSRTISVQKNTSNTTTSSSKNSSLNNSNDNSELSCEQKFFSCMDNVCLDNNGIRANCSSSYDSFETIQKDGNSIRVGNDLYTYAKGSCIDVLNSCELKDRNDFENNYKAKIQTDFLTKNYMEAMAYTGEEASQEALQQYILCMQPLCGNNFKDCFSISNVERRAPKCENVLEKTKTPLAVKKAFYEEMERLNLDFCKNVDGYIDYDTKICKVKVVFGVPKTTWKNGVEYLDVKDGFSKELTSKYFNVGEIVECTQEYFSTFYEENNNFAKGIVQMATGITKAVGGVVLTVAGAIYANKDLIGSGVKLITHGTADSLEGYIKVDDGTKKGACYINNQYVAPLNQYFKINIIQ